MEPLVMPPKDTVIRAGAGAGKTTELIARILGQVLHFKSVERREPRLVVTTFTRKATQEIRERLLVAARKLGDPEVLRYVQRGTHLSISTIHSSLQKFLAEAGALRGLPQDLQFLSASDERRMERQALQRALTENGTADALTELLEHWNLKKDFWDSLREARRHRARWGALQFVTGESLREFRDRELALVNRVRREVARELPQRDLNEKWLRLAEKLSGETTTLSEELRLWESLGNMAATKSTKDLQSKLADLKNHQIKALSQWTFSDEHLEKFDRVQIAFRTVFEAWERQLDQLKVNQGSITMEDLELWTLTLARENPAAAKAFAERWDFWMVDEFQDTSPLQIEILRHLRGDRPCFVVGDPQQSIYLFRGARSEVFETFERELESKGAELLTKNINRRSQPALMHFLNDLLTSTSPQFSAMQVNPAPKPAQAACDCEALFWPVAKGTEGAERTTNGEHSEAAAITERVFELLQMGTPAGEICILGRTHDQLAKWAQVLESRGLKTHLSARDSEKNQRELKDALCLLHFLLLPEDDLNLAELLRSPAFRVSDPSLELWAREARGGWWNQREILRQGGSPQELEVLSLLENELKTARTWGLCEPWLRTLQERGVFAIARQKDPSGQREAALWKLVADFRRQERLPGFSPFDFIQQWRSNEQEALSDLAPPITEPDRVRLMTIHGSKGLEFSQVLLGGCGSSNIKAEYRAFMIDEKSPLCVVSLRSPHDEALAKVPLANTWSLDFKAREVAEEERLLYVAVTRAKEGVSLFWESPAKGTSWAAAWEAKWADSGVAPENLPYRVKWRTEAPQPVQFQISEIQEETPRSPWSTPPAPDSDQSPVAKESFLRLRFEDLQRQQLGVRVHALLESMKGRWQDPRLSELRERLLRTKAVDLEYLIEKGFVEQSFLLKTGQGLVQGRIDLWGRDAAGKVWIVDYKTGSSRQRDQALEQLRFYAQALQQLGEIKSHEEVGLLPLYLFDDEPSVAEDYRA